MPILRWRGISTWAPRIKLPSTRLPSAVLLRGRAKLMLQPLVLDPAIALIILWKLILKTQVILVTVLLHQTKVLSRFLLPTVAKSTHTPAQFPSLLGNLKQVRNREDLAPFRSGSQSLRTGSGNEPALELQLTSATPMYRHHRVSAKQLFHRSTFTP